MKPLVSVVIPTWNRAGLIVRAINSVLSQTYSNWELIIVDDGSTDNTDEVVKKFQENDTRIRFIKHEKNSGGNSVPKNIGIKNAAGEYIAFLDSDDEYLPEKMEKQINLFNKSEIKNLGFVGCNNFRINGETSLETKILDKGNIYEKLLHNYFITTPGIIMIKREVLNKIGKFDENLKFSNDTDFFIRIAKSGFNFYFVDEPLFKYHEHNSSMTNTFNEDSKIQELLKIYERNITDLNSEEFFALAMGSFEKSDYKKSREYFNKSFKLKATNTKSFVGFLLLSTGVMGTTLFKYIKSVKNKK